jgi:hypothetical protein
MKLSVSLLAVIAVLALGAPATAQEDEEGRASLGIGGGLVRSESGTEPYLSANMRFRIGYRPEGTEREGGIAGFIEPEIGYWSGDETFGDWSDTLVGVNVGGVVRLRVFEYFIGAGVGYHTVDGERRVSSTRLDTFDEGALGLNAQFGFDVRLAERMSVFGVSRFDLIDLDDVAASVIGEQQTKAYLGLRFRL